MTCGSDAKLTLNVTVHDPRALRRAAWERAKEGGTTAWEHADFRRRAAAWERAKEGGTTAWEHADFRRRAGGVEADLLTLLDDRMSPPGASIDNSSAELFRLESVL